MSKTGLVKILLFALLLAISVILAGCLGEETGQDEVDTETVQIGYLPITHSLPLVVAEEEFIEEDEFEVELVRFSSWPELTEAFQGGQIEGAITMFELALLGQERDIPYEVVLLSHREGDVLVASDDIDSPADFEGERVAIPHRLSGHNILLNMALQDAGISYEDVNIVEMAPPEMPSALVRDEIKGYIVAEPFGAQAVVGGHGQALLRAQDIWEGWICCGLVINPGFLEENPEKVEKIADGIIEAGKFIDENREEAISIAEDHFEIEREYWETSLEWIYYSDLRFSRDEFRKIEEGLYEIPWDGEKGDLYDREADLDKLLYDKYLKD